MWGKRWLAQLGTENHQPIERAIDAVHRTPADRRLDSETTRRALAASEVVAASVGKPSAALPQDAHVLAHRCADRLRTLRERAHAAVERIRTERGPETDPHDLYDEPDGATEHAAVDAREWRTEMDLLSMRLAD
jgi:hypothetical protein